MPAGGGVSGVKKESCRHGETYNKYRQNIQMSLYFTLLEALECVKQGEVT